MLILKKSIYFLAFLITSLTSIAGSGACNYDSECTGEEICSKNLCTTMQNRLTDGTIYSLCDSNSDCKTNLKCFAPEGKKTSYCVPSYETFQKCNTTDDCRVGFVCVGGWASLNAYATVYQAGNCKPTVILRHICMAYELETGVMSKGIVVMAIISLGGTFLFGKIDAKPIIMIAIAIGLIFGGLQVMYLFTGDRFETCETLKTIEISSHL